jgi:hypothetical protein
MTTEEIIKIVLMAPQEELMQMTQEQREAFLKLRDIDQRTLYLYWGMKAKQEAEG